MRIAGFQMGSVVDGYGVRNVVFVQGCAHACPGCHNPETHDFKGGREMPEYQVARKLKQEGCRNVTISGGDPFYQTECLTSLLDYLGGCDIWVYTGFEYEQLERLYPNIISRINVLVDGNFVISKRTAERPFVGSSNQRLVDCKTSLLTGVTTLWQPPAEIHTEFDSCIERVGGGNRNAELQGVADREGCRSGEEASS